MNKKIILLSALLGVSTFYAQEKDSISSSRSIDEVTITSTGLKRTLKDFASSVDIISASQIKELAIPTVGDAMRMIPGANFIDEDGRGLKPGVGLRGLNPSRNSNTLVVIDGKIPIGQSYSDMGGYYMMPVGAIENIEVIRGASPVLYGNGSIGGIINIITKKGSIKPQTDINLQYGNSNTLNLGVSTSGSSDDFKYYVGFNRRQGDGFRKSRGKYNTNDLTANFGGKFNEKNELRAFVNMFYEYSETPGGLTQAQWDEDPRQSVNPYDFFEAKRFSASINYKRTFDELNSITASLYGSYLKRDWYMDNRNADATKIKYTGALRDIPTIGLFVDYERLNTLWNHKNKFLAGVRLHTDVTHENSVVSNNFGEKGGTTTSSSSSSIAVVEGYVFDEFNLTDNFIINPAIRFTHADYRRELYTQGTWQNKSDNNFIYSLGGLYKFSDNYRLFFTYSKGYQMPLYRDLFALDASEDLGAETSNNYELGFRLRPAHWVDFEGSLYILDFDNKVITEGGLRKNGGKSFHRGIELNASFYPTEGLKLYTNSAIQRATSESGTTKGNDLPYAPRYLVTLGAKYQFNIGEGNLITNVYTTYVGKQFSDANNTPTGSANGNVGAIPKYNLLNATINYNIGDWNFNLNGLNLLDKQYFTTRHSSWGGIMPAAGISVLAGVGYKF